MPRLVELGIPVCIPCAMMAPGLEELKKEYAGRLEVESLDTLRNPGAKGQYDAPFCATQIFIDPSGKELFRHVGYYSKKDILAKWRELGIDLEAPPQRQDAPESAVRPKTGGGLSGPNPCRSDGPGNRIRGARTHEAGLWAQCPRSGGGQGLPPLVLFGIAAAGAWVVHRTRCAWRKDGGSRMSKIWKIAIVVVLVAVVAIVIINKQRGSSQGTDADKGAAQVSQPAAGLPRLLDLGSTVCIPCKMMAPILEELKKEYEGRLQVEFIDVMVNPDAARPYKISLIPTQIFFDASGKERFRHEGFFSKEDILAKWKELGVDLSAGAPAQAPETPAGPTFSRLEPAKADDRPKTAVCYMCDGDVNPKALVVVKSAKGDVRLCGPHCYFIMYSCLTEDKTGIETKVSVTDWAGGNLIPATEAVYLYGTEEKTGRPTIKAFAGREAAEKERQASGGNLIAWNVLQEKELAARCGFCDRAVYPQDAARVDTADGIHTWGCCSHCALGVAARTGKDIEVHQPDRLTGEMIVVKTASGGVASLEPKTAVAWFGLRKAPDGKFVSAGCFHQGFFVNEENLVKWVEQNPTETGKAITVAQALADKMKLSPQQIQKACKIGECAPK